jgi:hypothetical protein
VADTQEMNRLRECAVPAPSVGIALSERRVGRILIRYCREVKRKLKTALVLKMKRPLIGGLGGGGSL